MASLTFRRRLLIILYILSFSVSVIIFSVVMKNVAVEVDYTSYRQYTVDGSKIYFAQNYKDAGFLFALNTSGRVERIFSSRSVSNNRILAVSAYDGNVYLVLESFIEKKSKEDPNAIESDPAYRIVCLDNKFNVLSRTPAFAIDDDALLKGFSAEATGLFMTFVSKDGSVVKVYSIASSNLMDEKDAAEAGKIDVEGVRSKRADTDRFFSDALYSKGQLYVRTDADTPVGIFAPDSYIKNIVSKMKLNIGQIFKIYSVNIIWYVAIVLIWFILLYLIFRLLEDKNRSFYYILIAELVLFIIVGTAILVIAGNYQEARSIEHSRFGVISLMGLSDDAGMNQIIDYSDPTIYDTDRYQDIRRSITKFVKRAGNDEIFYDVLVLRLRDSYVCASASGRNQELISDIYGSELSVISTTMAKGNRYIAQDFKVEGQGYRAVAVANSDIAADYALVGIINSTTIDKTVFVDNRGTFILFLIVYAIASAIVVFIWFLQMRDLSAIEEALASTAFGNPIPERPAFLGRDVKDMWDSISEIHKKIEEIQYAKLRILEAYYRFAPKNVEKILDKTSIIEVKNGDCRDLGVSIGTISIDVHGQRRFNKMDNLMGIIGEYQKDHDSIIISKAADMTSLQILFLENVRDTIGSFVDIYNRVLKNDDLATFSVLLLYEHGKFGVVGNDDETSTYYYTQSKELIRNVSDFISAEKLRLVVSEAVINREQYKGNVRFIGYAGLNSSGQEVKLYEVLDACPVRERTIKMATLYKYEEALQLFYENDFYFARTKFTEILKELPDDMLIRWYVFQSDKCLNEGADGEGYKYVHI